MAGYSSASWASWCARNGRITKDTPPPFNLPSTTSGYTPEFRALTCPRILVQGFWGDGVGDRHGLDRGERSAPRPDARGREPRRGPIPQRAVRPPMVEIQAMVFHGHLRLLQRLEHLPVHQLIPQPAGERLAVGV